MEKHLNLTISLGKWNDVSVDVDEPETGESSRIVVTQGYPANNPEFNERIGNEIWWWICEWMIQLEEEEGLYEKDSCETVGGD